MPGHGQSDEVHRNRASALVDLFILASADEFAGRMLASRRNLPTGAGVCRRAIRAAKTMPWWKALPLMMGARFSSTMRPLCELHAGVAGLDPARCATA